MSGCRCGRPLIARPGDLTGTCAQCRSLPTHCACPPLAAEGGPRVVRLDAIEPERVTWVWPGYLPAGKLVTIDGDPGVGKSTLTLDIAARVTTGSPMPDGTAPAKGAVLVMSAEDGLADTIRPRLDAAGADPARVLTITEIVTYGGDGQRLTRPPAIPGDLPAVERVVAEHGVVLVVWDVLVAYLAAGVDSHRDQDVRRALHLLAAMAERCGCCVIALRHLTKAGGGSPVYRGGGSIGIIGAARAGYVCGADPDDGTGQRRVLACAKANLAAEPPALAYRLVPDDAHGCARVDWLGVSEHRAAALLADPGGDDRTERDEAAEWLTGYLTDEGGEAARADILRAARAAGYADSTLKRAKDRAGVTHRSAGFPRRTVWVLPVGSPPRRLPSSPQGEPTGPDQGKRQAGSAQSAQSAQGLGPEPTGPPGPGCTVCGGHVSPGYAVCAGCERDAARPAAAGDGAGR